MQFPVPTFKTRRGLLVLDYQNEFLDQTGRCQVSQPGFVNNTINLIKEFRKDGGEVIWVKTEYQGQRRLRDVRLILAEQDSCYASRDQIEPDPEVVSTGPVTSKLNTGGTGKTNGKEGKGKKETNGNKKESPKSTTDPPKQVSTDAFLSIPDTHLCEKNTPGAEFIAALTPDIKKPTDRTISKSWYSAFRETQLLMLLQSRLVTEVYICGAMTNTSVYATALDAVQFGLKVLVPSDCCGFRYLSAHRDAMAEMTGKLGVETMSCTVLLRLWDSQRNNGDDDATQVHTMDTAQLAVVVENAIRAGEGGVQLEEPPASDAEHDGSEDHYDDYNSEDMEVARRKGMSPQPPAAEKEKKDAARAARIMAAHAEESSQIDLIDKLLVQKGIQPPSREQTAKIISQTLEGKGIQPPGKGQSSPSPQNSTQTPPGKQRVRKETTQKLRSTPSATQESSMNDSSAPMIPAQSIPVKEVKGKDQPSSSGPERNAQPSSNSNSAPSPSSASKDVSPHGTTEKVKQPTTEGEVSNGNEENVVNKDNSDPEPTKQDASNDKSTQPVTPTQRSQTNVTDPKGKSKDAENSTSDVAIESPALLSNRVQRNVRAPPARDLSSRPAIPPRAAAQAAGLSLLGAPGSIRRVKSPSHEILSEEDPGILEADSAESEEELDYSAQIGKLRERFRPSNARTFIRASEAAERTLQGDRVIIPLSRSGSGRRRLVGRIPPQPGLVSAPPATATTAASSALPTPSTLPPPNKFPAHSPSAVGVSQHTPFTPPTGDPEVDRLSNKLAGLQTNSDDKSLVKSTHSYNHSISSVTSSVRSLATEASGLHSTGNLPAITPSASLNMSSPQPPTPSHASTKRRAHESSAPVLGEGDIIGEGDSTLVTDLLPLDQFPDLFERLKSEIQWETMYHRGGEVPRLVAVEADVGADGSFPLYRHPNDESPPVLPFSPTVAKIRDYAQKAVGHKLNHVLIQLYRDGSDHISEHSDKTLDIVQGSKIVNVSLGAQRSMTLRAKRSSAEWEAHHLKQSHTPSSSITSVASDPVQTPPGSAPPPARPAQKIPLPHNSMFVLGQRTNAYWLHAIRPDKRSANLKSSAETAFGGQRISFTFRHIGTFLVPHFPTLNPSDGTYLIYGQGAVSKTRASASPITPGTSPEGEQMLCAFGTENHLSDFDWAKYYGPGFNVLHFGTKPVPIGALTYSPTTNPHARILKVLFDHLKLPVECYPSSTADCEDTPSSITFTDNRSNPPAVITATSAFPVLTYLSQTVPGLNIFPPVSAGLNQLAQTLGLLGEVLQAIDNVSIASIPLARSGIIEGIERLEKKIADLPQTEGVGILQVAIWQLMQDCVRFKVGKRGRWSAMERIWEVVGEECGVEMT